MERGQSWVDLSDSVSLRSLDGCISPQKRERKREGRRGVQLNYHLPLLDARVFVYCFFFFWHFCALILRSFRLYGTLTLKAWRLRPLASACMYTGVCMRCTQLELCGLLKDFWWWWDFHVRPQPLIFMQAGWRKTSRSFFFFPYVAYDAELHVRERNGKTGKKPSRKQTCKLKSARKRRRPQRLFIMISKCFVCRTLWWLTQSRLLKLKPRHHRAKIVIVAETA